MSERTKCHVHTEGDQSDVLFQLPLLSRRLRVGDTLTVTLVGGFATVYKVESVDYKLVQAERQNPSDLISFWESSEVYYGVSIVP